MEVVVKLPFKINTSFLNVPEKVKGQSEYPSQISMSFCQTKPKSN